MSSADRRVSPPKARQSPKGPRRWNVARFGPRMLSVTAPRFFLDAGSWIRRNAASLGGLGCGILGAATLYALAQMLLAAGPVDAVTRVLTLACVLGLGTLAILLHCLSTERRNTATLRTEAERLRVIVDSSHDAMLLTDRSGRILEFNPAAAEIFGYATGDAIGHNAVTLLVAEDQRDLLDASTAAALSRHTDEWSFEIDVVDASGRRFPAEVSLGHSGSDVAQFVACVRDISRRRATEDALTDARDRALAGERTKADFLAIMSHEMRTPLNGLLGSLQILRDQKDLTQAHADLLDRMQSSGALLLALVNDVLDLSKFESGKLTAETSPFVLPDLLEGVVQTLMPLADAERTQLGWSFVDQPLSRVLGDAQKLRQILLNLAGNAVKFTPDGRVDVEVEALPGPGAWVEFRVIDTGVGIAEPDMDRIFEDFETLDSSYSRQAGGTGLGLGIARRLTGIMGGELGAESEMGEGSVFWIRVPLPQERKRPGDTIPGTDPQTRQGKTGAILLVEDNEINRFVARTMLESDGHHVTEAQDGAQGVALAQAQAFDVILMDISMPRMDGTEAAQTIRADGGASALAPIVAVTAHVLPAEVSRYIALGITTCLSKPLERETLLQVVADLLEGDVGKPVSAANGFVHGPYPILDQTQLDAFRSGADTSVTTPLLRRFLNETETVLPRIMDAETPHQTRAEQTHRLSGSCATFGLVALRMELRALEDALKAGGDLPVSRLSTLPMLWLESRSHLLQVWPVSDDAA